MIPNSETLAKHLTIFAEACSATEVVLYEKTTFLVIATSNPATLNSPTQTQMQMHASRHEKTSEIIKEFKHAASRRRDEFKGFEIEFPEFKAVMCEMTKNTYVMVICHDPRVG